jgi:hypothetical protein
VLKRALLLMLAVSAAHAQTPWLTVMGDPGDPAVDTIEVDPVPVSVAGDHRTMRVRVNRSAQRTNWDGIPYRSYESTVQFDCASNTARYLEIRFYLQPGWRGEIHRTETYRSTMPRWMVFRGVDPNPYQRIITAACGAMGRR